eukprot:8201141-Pyramimonas_sp.AAC.1
MQQMLVDTHMILKQASFSSKMAEAQIIMGGHLGDCPKEVAIHAFEGERLTFPVLDAIVVLGAAYNRGGTSRASLGHRLTRAGKDFGANSRILRSKHGVWPKKAR